MTRVVSIHQPNFFPWLSVIDAVMNLGWTATARLLGRQ